MYSKEFWNVISKDLEDISKVCPECKSLEGSSILITGASGMLPAYIIDAIMVLNKGFLNKTCRIIAYARNKKKLEERFAPYVDKKYFEIITGDFFSIDWKQYKTEFVIHAASPSNPREYGHDPIGCLRINSEGTRILLDQAYNNNSRGFLYFSSAEIYGSIPGNEMPIPENHPGILDPIGSRSCYSIGKAAGESLCSNYSRFHGLCTYIVRPFHCYGSGFSRSDSRVFADFIKQAIQKKSINLVSDGKAMRSFCYISDATFGFIKILLKGKSGEAYNIGNPEQEISVLHFAKIISKMFEDVSINFSVKNKNLEYTGKAVLNILPDINKLKSLGWVPTVNIEDGIIKTITAMKDTIENNWKE